MDRAIGVLSWAVRVAVAELVGLGRARCGCCAGLACCCLSGCFSRPCAQTGPMAPGSKNRLAIVRTSIIFISVASIAIQFEVMQPEVRARWPIESCCPSAQEDWHAPRRLKCTGGSGSPIVKHWILVISFVNHGMQVGESPGSPTVGLIDIPA